MSRINRRPFTIGLRALVPLVAFAACDALSEEEELGVVDSAICLGDTSTEGVDVSHWTGAVSWTQVKAAGRQFAFAKATEGTGFIDSTFAGNWSGMKSAGLIRGAYHFFKDNVDGTAQADFAYNTIVASGGLLAGDLPVAVDLEELGLTGAPNPVATLQATLSRLQTLTGRMPIIYTNWNTWNMLGSPTGFEAYPIWVANPDNTCAFVPINLPNVKFWQYSWTGSVPGIAGSALLDKFAGTYSDLVAFAGGGGTPLTVSFGFGAMPAWSSSYDALWWGSAASWIVTGGGQTGSYLRAWRTSQGSSAKVKVYNITPYRNYTISIYMRGDASSVNYWSELGYRLGNHSAESFDQSPVNWTLVNKFSSTGGYPNGSGGVWKLYSKTFYSGASTQISVGFKNGSSGGVGPASQWDTLKIQ